MKTLGQRIKARRNELKLSQRNLASTLEIAHVSVSQWERDETRPNGDNLMGLARALSCEPSWLLEYSGDTPVAADKLPEPVPVLSSRQKTLLHLFEELPDTEQDKLLETLQEKKQYYDKLFEQLARRRIKNHK